MYKNTQHEFSMPANSVLNDPAPNREDAAENNPAENAVKENENLGVVESGLMADSQPTKPPVSNVGWSDIFGNGELKMKTVRKGKRNSKPQPTDVCEVKMFGKLEDGKVVDKHNFLRIKIGDHEVIQGLELALPLMNVGEKALVVIGPRFAYGPIGNPPNVPPNATIKYVVELLKAEMETPLENIPHEVRMTMATAKRERGNWWYTRQDTIKAVQCYKKAVDLLDETISYVTPEGDIIENTDDKIKIVIKEKMKVYNNLAAAQLLLQAYDSALASVLEVLKHEPNNVKALFRKSKILTAKGSVSEAVVPLKQACLVEPKNTAVISELNKCVKLVEIEKRDEKILCKKMLGQFVTDEKPADKPMEMKKNCFWNKMLKTATTATVMATVAVVLSYKYKNYQFF